MARLTLSCWAGLFARRSRGGLPVVAALLGLALSPGVAAEEYDLMIDRVYTVGQRLAFEGEAYNHWDLTQRYGDDEPIEQSDTNEIDLEGVLEVLALDDAGGVTRLAVGVLRYDIEVNGEGVELDTTRRILASVDGEEVVYSYEDGTTLPELVFEPLDELLDELLTQPGDAEDDEKEAVLFGLDRPRTPGESWEIDAIALFKNLGDGDEAMVTNDDTEVTGNAVRFVRIDERLFGEPVAVLELDLGAAGFAFSPGIFPDFMEVEESFMAFTGEAWEPLDPNSGQGREVFEMEVAYRASGTIPGEDVELVIDVEVEAGRTLVMRRVRD